MYIIYTFLYNSDNFKMCELELIILHELLTILYEFNVVLMSYKFLESIFLNYF